MRRMDGCVMRRRDASALATMPTRRADALRGLFDDGDGDADAAAHARRRADAIARRCSSRSRRDADDGWDVTLTTRATSMRSHAREIALPGGKRDARDACDAGTAAREAREEIGMRSAEGRGGGGDGCRW